MSLTLKNPQLERLADELSKQLHETKTETIRVALEERKVRVANKQTGLDRKQRILDFLQSEVWPTLPKSAKGKPLTKKKKEALLGYGKLGV
jgi:antitoxin VapB